MATLAQERTAAQLLHLASIGVQDFPKSRAERNLVRQTAIGAEAKLGGDRPWYSERDNADTGPTFWHGDRIIRAALIRWLCLSQETKGLIGPDGISIVGACIVGDLRLDYAEIQFPIYFLCCRIKGTTSLVECQIPMLALSGSWTGDVIANGSKIKGSMYLNAGFRSNGTVSLRGTQIGGDLDCVKGTFIDDKNGLAIDAQGIDVGGDIRLRADTETELVSPRHPATQPARAIPFRPSAIQGLEWASIPNRFQAVGLVRLAGARVGGDISFVGGEFLLSKPSSPDDASIRLNLAKIDGGIYIHHAVGKPKVDYPQFKADGLIDLGDVSATRLDLYDLEGAKMSLDGLTYTAITYTANSKHSEVRKLLDLLALDHRRATQPYRQAAKVLKDLGRSNDSIEVLRKMEENIASGLTGQLSALIGYGYAPMNAFGWLAGITAVGAAVYWRAHRMGRIVPTDDDAYATFKSTPLALPPHYPRFQPIIFSLENTFPLVKLGQTDRWQCDPQEAASNTANSRFKFLLSSAHFLRWYMWIQIILGWLLATLFLAAVAGLVQRG